MPQLFQVLRCYKCSVFQVHQIKKSHKFQCKMCGEKQSLKRHYGLGNGQECRLHVQKLNGIRGEQSEEEVITSGHSEEEFEHKESKIGSIPKLEPCKSKWSTFVNDEDNIAQDENEMSPSNNVEILSEHPKRIKKCKGRTGNLMLNPQEATVDKRKFETPYKYEENNQRIQEKFNPEISKKLVFKQKCNEISNNLNNFQGSIKGKSKWAQYVGSQEKLSEPNVPNCSKNDSSSCKTNNLFELCDDTDLDEILNI